MDPPSDDIGDDDGITGSGYVLGSLEECYALRTVHNRVRQFAALLQLWLEDPKNFDFVGEWVGASLPAKVSKSFQMQQEEEDVLIAAIKTELDALLGDVNAAEEDKIERLKEVSDRQKMIFVRRVERLDAASKLLKDFQQKQFQRMNQHSIEDDRVENDIRVGCSMLSQSCTAILGKVFMFLKASVEKGKLPVGADCTALFPGGERQRTVYGLTQGLHTSLDKVLFPRDFDDVKGMVKGKELKHLFKLKYADQPWHFGADELEYLREIFLKQYAAEEKRKIDDDLKRKKDEIIAELSTLRATALQKQQEQELRDQRRASATSSAKRDVPTPAIRSQSITSVDQVQNTSGTTSPTTDLMIEAALRDGVSGMNSSFHLDETESLKPSRLISSATQGDRPPIALKPKVTPAAEGTTTESRNVPALDIAPQGKTDAGRRPSAGKSQPVMSNVSNVSGSSTPIELQLQRDAPDYHGNMYKQLEKSIEEDDKRGRQQIVDRTVASSATKLVAAAGLQAVESQLRQVADTLHQQGGRRANSRIASAALSAGELCDPPSTPLPQSRLFTAKLIPSQHNQGKRDLLVNPSPTILEEAQTVTQGSEPKRKTSPLQRQRKASHSVGESSMLNGPLAQLARKLREQRELSQDDPSKRPVRQLPALTGGTGASSLEDPLGRRGVSIAPSPPSTIHSALDSMMMLPVNSSQAGVALEPSASHNIATTVAEQLMIDAMIQSRLQRSLARQSGNGDEPSLSHDNNRDANDDVSAEIAEALQPDHPIGVDFVPTASFTCLNQPSRVYRDYIKPLSATTDGTVVRQRQPQGVAIVLGEPANVGNPMSHTKNVFAAQPLKLTSKSSQRTVHSAVTVPQGISFSDHVAEVRKKNAARPPTGQQQSAASNVQNQNQTVDEDEAWNTIASKNLFPLHPIKHNGSAMVDDAPALGQPKVDASRRREDLAELLDDTVHQVVALDGSSLRIAVARPKYSYLI